jgi:uncharacterized protein involved in exopolysaccharide biosynthesis
VALRPNLVSDLSRRDVAYLFFKRKNQIIAACLVSALFAAAGSYLSPRSYRASATVYLVRNLPPIAATGPTLFNQILDRREVLNSEVDLITSRAVGESVAEELGLLREPEGPPPPPSNAIVGAIRSAALRLREAMLSVGLIDRPGDRREAIITGLLSGLIAAPALNSSFITLTYQAEDPDFAVRAVNAFTKVYETQRLTLLKRPKLEAFYDEQIARAGANLQAIDDELAELKAQTGVVAGDEQLRLALQEQSGLNTAIRDVQSMRQELQERMALLQRRIQDQPDSVVASKVVQRNPVLASLEQRRLELEAERAVELNRFAPNSPAIQEIDRSIARLTESITKEPATVVGNESTGVNAIRSTLQTDLYRAQSDFSAAVVRERELIARRDALAQQLSRLGTGSERLKRLSESAVNAMRIYDTYVRQKEEARIAAETDTGITNVQVVSQGSTPGRPVYPRLVQIGLGAVLGLMLGIALAFAAEIFGQTLDRRDDVERELGLPVLASIPYVRFARRRLRIG